MANSSQINEYIAKFKQTKVLVIGDICLDRFVRGTVTRISPEAPIPVMSCKQESKMLGQGGNAFANLIGLGVQANIIAVIGDDRDGEIVRALVETTGADDTLLITNTQSPTTVKTRYSAGQQQLLRVDIDAIPSTISALEPIIIDKIISLIPSQDAVILSDYGLGVLSNAVIRTAIDAANAAGIPILVDPRGSDLSKYSGATVATPNRKELAEATGGAPTETDTDIVETTNKLIKQSGIKSIVATRSQDGMSVISPNTDPVHLRITAREVFDVSGAGDTVIATIAAGLSAGANLVDAAGIANIAAGIVVGKVGTTPIRVSELIQTVNEHETHMAATPAINAQNNIIINDLNIAREQIEKWQARGLKVGFTNGCFDILHAGHVNYLMDAAKYCDRLVLAINTDKSVRILKGPTRPVNNENSRATVMAGLGSIDMVVFFGAENEGDDNTASPVIKCLKPDIYFKGGDYTIETLPEAKIVHAYGGSVKLMPITEGHSTTGIIRKITAA